MSNRSSKFQEKGKASSERYSEYFTQHPPGDYSIVFVLFIHYFKKRSNRKKRSDRSQALATQWLSQRYRTLFVVIASSALSKSSNSLHMMKIKFIATPRGSCYTNHHLLHHHLLYKSRHHSFQCSTLHCSGTHHSRDCIPKPTLC